MAQITLENIYKNFSSEPSPASVEESSSFAVPLIQPNATTEEKGEKKAKKTLPTLRGINLTVNDGEFLVLVGPSGCGKSTLLRLIAGLEEITSGVIKIGDRKMNDLPPKDRDIAMVFQSYALYPHLTVYDNIAFGLRRIKQTDENITKNNTSSRPAWLESLLVGITRKLPKPYLSAQEKAINQQVRQVAELLQIDHLLDRRPKQLSGGQKQRVALGRAIARNPQVFLMDEPLSNLDAKLRAETRSQIVKLQQQLGVTTLYVTHDQTEAMTMGDRIAVMNQGQIQQVASPLVIYNQPANRFVAEFIGSPPMNFLTVDVETPVVISSGSFRLTLADDWASHLSYYQGRTLLLGIRPEHFAIAESAADHFPVTITLIEALGNETYLSVQPDPSYLNLLAENNDSLEWKIRISPEENLRIGDKIWLSINQERIHFFDPKTDLEPKTGEKIAKTEKNIRFISV